MYFPKNATYFTFNSWLSFSDCVILYGDNNIGIRFSFISWRTDSADALLSILPKMELAFRWKLQLVEFDISGIVLLGITAEQAALVWACAAKRR